MRGKREIGERGRGEERLLTDQMWGRIGKPVTTTTFLNG
jgi:hypothetical protein